MGNHMRAGHIHTKAFSGRFRWKDATRAKQLVNQGMAIIGNNPSVEELQPIAAQLVGLMPGPDIPHGPLPW